MRDNHLARRAGTGRLVTCLVIPGEPLPHDDYAADAGITDPIPGTVLPELVAWMPTSGLSHPLGPISPDAWQRVDQILRRGSAFLALRGYAGNTNARKIG